MQSLPLRQRGGHPPVFATKTQKHAEMVHVQADKKKNNQKKNTDGLPKTQAPKQTHTHTQKGKKQTSEAT